MRSKAIDVPTAPAPITATLFAFIIFHLDLKFRQIFGIIRKENLSNFNNNSKKLIME
ncbi:hypothetical protein CBU03nite_13380 [Clostridium butyricum]|nr:hypothetical protein Cbu04g_29500 [Clostridium butyricum]GEQ16498.1 hypothetical protein CBU01nite_11340 [Clostridium butyricum]GEQ24915.1 hypothetical protein CBU03nite_13380 [Clostridium butyricum]